MVAAWFTRPRLPNCGKTNPSNQASNSHVQSTAIKPVELETSKSSTTTCNLDDTKFDALLETVFKPQQQESENVTAGKDDPGKSHDALSGCAKGFPLNPTKKTGDAGTIVDDSLLTDHVDDASDFLNWKELPQDIHDQMKAQEDKLMVQTSSSLTRFQNNLTGDPATGEQKEWNFTPFPPTSKKIHVSTSESKLNLRQCPKEQ